MGSDHALDHALTHARRPALARLQHVRLLALPAAIALVWLVRPGNTGPTLCPFALVTGTACPGCGLTRAAGSLVRADLGAALAFHPLVIAVALWAGTAWAVAAVRATGREVRLSPSLVNRLLVLTAVLFVVVWLARMATGTLPSV